MYYSVSITILFSCKLNIDMHYAYPKNGAI